MGAAKQDEMVIWTSSELPEVGFGLVDYQTNAAVDRWVKEKVLLASGTTQCTVPKGVFPGEGAMLRAIAYGNELNLAHPPRPADPKAPWEPVWAAKVRVKSVARPDAGHAADGADADPGRPGSGAAAGARGEEGRQEAQGAGPAEGDPRALRRDMALAGSFGGQGCAGWQARSSVRPPAIESETRAMDDSLKNLAQRLDQFAKEREWQQFHSPKNLASALIVEAGELLEHFQWMTDEQSRQLPPDKRDAIGAEMADVLLYLIQLSTALGIDPIAAAKAKLRLNESRYPVDRSRGSSKKYDEL